MNCPHCGSRSTGKVAADQYYCWDCCIEFAHTPNGWQMFRVDDEGELQMLQPEEQGQVYT